MLSLNKDSTISSKASEYDNVPVLPLDYHSYPAAPFPTSTLDRPQVSPRRSSLSSSATVAVSPSSSLQYEEPPLPSPRLLQFPTEENQQPRQQQLLLSPASLDHQHQRQHQHLDDFRRDKEEVTELPSRRNVTTHQPQLQSNPT